MLGSIEATVIVFSGFAEGGQTLSASLQLLLQLPQLLLSSLSTLFQSLGLFPNGNYFLLLKKYRSLFFGHFSTDFLLSLGKYSVQFNFWLVLRVPDSLFSLP